MCTGDAGHQRTCPFAHPCGTTLLPPRPSHWQMAVHDHSAFGHFCPCRILMQIALTHTQSSSLPAELPSLLTVSSILPGLLTFIFCVCLNNSQVETSVKYLRRCQDWKHFPPLQPTLDSSCCVRNGFRSVLGWSLFICEAGMDPYE